MGGQLSPQRRTPNLVVSVVKDEADIYEIDLVKASVASGKVTEHVLPWKAPTLAGVPSVCHTFTDPDYDPSQPAFYYAKVIEVPTPRWSHYDCQANATTQAFCRQNPGLDVDIQERAWTSPIWSLP